jgi:hypothetical protein
MIDIDQEELQMPFYLKDRDINQDMDGVRSALIVPCRFCPAASLAVKEKKPYFELFRKLLRTASYESYVQGLKSRLESQGVRTDIYDSKLLNQFVVCMWTTRRRQDLARHAAGYDAVIVLGCDAALATISIIAFYVIIEKKLLLFGVPLVARLVFLIPFIVILLTIITMIMMIVAWKNKFWNPWAGFIIASLPSPYPSTPGLFGIGIWLGPTFLVSGPNRCGEISIMSLLSLIFSTAFERKNR